MAQRPLRLEDRAVTCAARHPKLPGHPGRSGLQRNSSAAAVISCSGRRGRGRVGSWPEEGVHDNAERPDQLTGLLPGHGGGHVLLTSRWQARGRQATPLRLGVLDRPDASSADPPVWSGRARRLPSAAAAPLNRFWGAGDVQPRLRTFAGRPEQIVRWAAGRPAVGHHPTGQPRTGGKHHGRREDGTARASSAPISAMSP